ncbi:response regulator transcription factor [Sphingomonas sp. CROZ-RG-20F-R02-07]|uniref:response regulator transcription factor n=1 Tax=Sphingomonas sp. CROZ-RG-20F-R02-07 TaxID=2914832 RepID=UPI001F5930C6|nr:response regulator transcription factor [Sphingomonas sp. CROZ-RG-20F-R02-07]
MAAEPLLYIVEDDAAFARTLQRSFEKRGYRVGVASDPAALETLLAAEIPAYAVVDLKLGQASGLTCVRTLAERDAETTIVVLTGYASIATAVEAVKLGATSYLAKPANTDDIEAAFGRGAGDVETPIGDRQTSIKTLEWERIQKTLAESDFNVSETARRLGMHRRTLARKLEKRPLR